MADMNGAQFLAAIFQLEEGEQINVRAFHARSGRRGFHDFLPNAQGAWEYVQSLPSDLEIYFGVNPRRGRDGSKEGVTRAHLLHADVDDKRFASHEDGRLATVGFDLTPTIVVDSGNGHHAYWLLTESSDDFNAAETMMRRLYLALGGLDATQDVSRVFRVPDTWNNKDPRNRRAVKVVFANLANTYTLADFDAILPALPVELPHREIVEVVADGERPSLELLRELLSFVDPCLPYERYINVWAAVAYYYPDDDGLALIDEWSSEARANYRSPDKPHGLTSSPRTQPEKHAGFKRQTGRVSTLGTLIHLAKEGGYAPPRRENKVTRGKNLGLAGAIRKVREDKLSASLLELRNPTYDDLPHYLRLFYDHLGPLTEPFPRDYTTMMALTFASALWPRIRFENLGLNLWCLSSVEQGSGKNKITDAIYKVVERLKEVQPQLYTSGTPEGMYRVLQDDKETGGGKQMACYLREFGHWLATLKREHMSGATGVLCNLYDGASVSHRLSKSEVIVTDPYVVFVGTTTPRAVVDNLSKSDLEGGFASRFWCLSNEYANENSNYEPSAQAVAELANLLDQHVRDHAHVRSVRFDVPEGSVPQAYLDFCKRNGIGTGEVRTFADALNDPRSPAGRDAARIKKVAAGLELLELVPQVQGNTVIVRLWNLLLAIALVERSMVYRDIIYTNIASTDEEKSMGAIQRVLDKSGYEGLSRAELMQRAHVKARELESLLGVLIEAELVSKREGLPGGTRYVSLNGVEQEVPG